MLAEFEQAESAMDGGFYKKELDYEEWLRQNALNEAGLEIPAGFVPAIQYVSFDSQGRAIGFLHLRLRLNDSLLRSSGHIGYSIRPSQRHKGYAKEQLRQGIREAMSKNISPILLTCSVENEASRRVIQSCGGNLENCDEGKERYWIEVKKDDE